MNTISLNERVTVAANRINWKLFSCFSLALLCLAVLQDLLGAIHQNASFYLSESLLFRAVWLLFIPIIFLQNYILNWYTNRIKGNALPIVLTTLSCCIIHTVAFSILVFLLSRLLFDHTYQTQGTFLYTLSEDLSKYVLVYGACGVYYLINVKQHQVSLPPLPTTITVGTGQQKMIVTIEDIIFITAASPYIILHTSEKKFIHAESLKSIAAKLPAQQFIRIHKSCIINRLKVISSKSRLNGDYDIRLVNQVDVRLSRNYVPAFKKWFG